MLKIYNTDMQSGKTVEISDFKKGAWINLTNPSDSEIKQVCQKLNIQEDFIRYSLDAEEPSRIDQEDDDSTILFIVDVPIADKEGNSSLYSTLPLGMIVVRDDFFITVSSKRFKIIEDFEKNKVKNFATYKKSRFILQILYANSSSFLLYLNQINKARLSTETTLKTSIRNRELYQMLALEKSLVYLATSLKSNELVMEKTMRGKIIKLYEEDQDLLEDALIENKQAIEMSKIYSDILSGTMDAYASVISNNLNDVMKFLTSITLVMSIPTMIFSFWGMNVSLPFESSSAAFIIIIAIAVLIAVVVTWWLKKKDML